MCQGEGSEIIRMRDLYPLDQCYESAELVNGTDLFDDFSQDIHREIQ